METEQKPRIPIEGQTIQPQTTEGIHDTDVPMPSTQLKREEVQVPGAPELTFEKEIEPPELPPDISSQDLATEVEQEISDPTSAADLARVAQRVNDAKR